MLIRKADSTRSKYRTDRNIKLMLILNSPFLSSKRQGCKVKDSDRKLFISPILPPIHMKRRV